MNSRTIIFPFLTAALAICFIFSLVVKVYSEEVQESLTQTVKSSAAERSKITRESSPSPTSAASTRQQKVDRSRGVVPSSRGSVSPARQENSSTAARPTAADPRAQRRMEIESSSRAAERKARKMGRSPETSTTQQAGIGSSGNDGRSTAQGRKGSPTGAAEPAIVETPSRRSSAKQGSSPSAQSREERRSTARSNNSMKQPSQSEEVSGSATADPEKASRTVSSKRKGKPQPQQSQQAKKSGNRNNKQAKNKTSGGNTHNEINKRLAEEEKRRKAAEQRINQERSRQLRVESQARAKNSIERETFINLDRDNSNRRTDYNALGGQINNLGTLIEKQNAEP